MSAVLAAAVAGAITGWVLGGLKPAAVVAAFSAGGMLVAVVAAGLMRQVAPAAIDVAGPAQYGYFALVMGLVAAIVGAAAGAAVSRVKASVVPEPNEGSHATPGQPNAV